MNMYMYMYKYMYIKLYSTYSIVIKKTYDNNNINNNSNIYYC